MSEPVPRDTGTDDASWCVADANDGKAKCLRCGHEADLPTMVGLNTFTGFLNGFMEDHRHCKPGDDA